MPLHDRPVLGREPVGRQASVVDLDPLGDGDRGPIDAGGEDVDLRGRRGVAGVGGVEVGRHLAEVFPIGRLL